MALHMIPHMIYFIYNLALKRVYINLALKRVYINRVYINRVYINLALKRVYNHSIVFFISCHKFFTLIIYFPYESKMS